MHEHILVLDITAMVNKGQIRDLQPKTNSGDLFSIDTIVLDKAIFSDVFEKDIRRVYLFKKSERIAKALSVILPAFKDSVALKERISDISVTLIDASIQPPAVAKDVLSRELLALTSILSVARSAKILSPMNVEIISREVYLLMQELGGYDDPRVSFEDTPSLSALARATVTKTSAPVQKTHSTSTSETGARLAHKGQDIKDTKNNRKEAILSVLKEKGPSYIKDISMMIRDVSEKTIQRELQALIDSGKVKKTGERRWTNYSLLEGSDAK